MKSIIGLSSLVLISLTSTALPAMAVSHLQDNTVSTSSNLEQSPIQVAGFLGGLNQVLNTVDRIRARQAQEAARERARIEQEERVSAAKQRQEEYAAAQRAAAEEKRLEAERRQAYYDNLSPEEKQAYLAQQQARQEAEAKLMLGIFGAFLGGGDFSGGSANTQQGYDPQLHYQNTPSPAAQPAPAPVQPISPFYGNGPSY